MVCNLFFYQIVLIALVWLFLMLSWLWPSEPTAVPPSPSKPVPPPRQRSKDPQPFTGLTCKPHCEACEQARETSCLRPLPPHPPSSPRREAVGATAPPPSIAVRSPTAPMAAGPDGAISAPMATPAVDCGVNSIAVAVRFFP